MTQAIWVPLVMVHSIYPFISRLICDDRGIDGMTLTFNIQMYFEWDSFDVSGRGLLNDEI